MLESKYQNSKINVYERLHNHARIRNQKLFSNNQVSPRKSVGATGRRSVNSSHNGMERLFILCEFIIEINYGCLLHYRGIKRKEEVK